MLTIRNIAPIGLALAGAALLAGAAFALTPDFAGIQEDGFLRWRWKLGIGLVLLPVVLPLAATALYRAMCWISDRSRAGPIL